MNQFLADLGTRWMWALALVLAFPAALLALNELAFELVRGGRPIATSVRFVRTWVLSALVLSSSSATSSNCPATTCGSAWR